MFDQTVQVLSEQIASSCIVYNLNKSLVIEDIAMAISASAEVSTVILQGHTLTEQRKY